MNRGAKQRLLPTVLAWSCSCFSSYAKKYKTIRRVPYSPDHIFDVVLNVADYHKYLPFCVKSSIKTHDKARKEMLAELGIGFKIFTDYFSSRVTYSKPHFIDTEAVNSPMFKQLHR
jgi:coenzyme Q-binding protein COQ10